MWILPSRGRPNNARRLIDAMRNTGCVSPVWMRLDDDDPTLDQYMNIPRPSQWVIVVGERKPLSDIYAEHYEAHPDSRWYGFIADDVVPETPFWERTLTRAALLPSRKQGLAFGDDGINGGNHATHFILNGKMVREVGWLCLPGLERIYIDTVWNDIARERKAFWYLPDVVLRHHHFSNGMALMDATYRKPGKKHDLALYEKWRYNRAGHDEGSTDD